MTRPAISVAAPAGTCRRRGSSNRLGRCRRGRRLGGTHRPRRGAGRHGPAPHWNSPEDFPAAARARLDGIHSTGNRLVLRRPRTRVRAGTDPSGRIVAGRIVADLEREGADSRRAAQSATGCGPGLADTLAAGTAAASAAGGRLASGGECVQTDRPGGRFYDWCIIPDGRIAVALGHADGPPLEASLTATMLQIAMKAHAATDTIRDICSNNSASPSGVARQATGSRPCSMR